MERSGMRNPPERRSQNTVLGISPFGRNDIQVITDFESQK
jgi:hypothetical protein